MPARKTGVDSVRLGGDAPATVRGFDAYLMVDWSSSGVPKRGNDSIWIAHGQWGPDGFRAGPPDNCATREEARRAITDVASRYVARGDRVLVGMDFSFGYPAGFAAALGLDTRRGSWRATHEHFSRFVTDDARNKHNRDAFADACNRRIAPSGPGPFWGCITRGVTPSLTQKRNGVFDFPYSGLEELRVSERRAHAKTMTQSVWKLNAGVSVGGQTILGIKYLHEMAEALGAKRWPFETGWSVPKPGAPSVWFAEIFPSLVPIDPGWESEHRARRDRTQVQACVRYAAERDAAGTLRSAFSRPADLDAETEARVMDEEGWILFV